MHEGHQQHLQKNCVFLIFVCVHFLFSCLFVQVHANVYSWECLCVGWFSPCLLYPSWWHTTCASLTFHSSSQTVPNSLFMHTSTLPSFGVDPPTSLTWPSAHETLATERRVHRIFCGKKIVRKNIVLLHLAKIEHMYHALLVLLTQADHSSIFIMVAEHSASSKMCLLAVNESTLWSSTVHVG